ncbi:MAG: ATP synthase F1 subunit epsilon [Rhodospirillales bacterium]|nr:ATP synthase F1 subunit epsilon [Rhodospirillales bacterium]MBO6788104.1 ATP synthase F1 subunit epsilon [Rhodospirillales bacterium]
MAEMVEFELVSPARLLKSEPVEMVVVPGAEGDIGVLPNHSPLICTVRPGVIKVMESGKVTEEIFVAGGFCEVSTERCTVLAEEAIMVADIDAGEARDRLSAAEKAVSEADEDGMGKAEDERRIAEAMVAAAASA